MLYSVIILYLITFCIIILLSVLAYNVLNNPIPDNLPVPPPFPDDGDNVGLDNNIMKTDINNIMDENGRVTMSYTYTPIDSNDIVTKIYTDTAVSDIVVNKKLMTLDGNNQMDNLGTITMYPSYTPTNNKDIATKEYVDNNYVTEATTSSMGIIKLAGDLSGDANNPVIANNILTLNKFADIIPNQLIGSDSLGQIINYSLGNNLTFNGSDLNINNIIKSVNGISPDSDGNVNILLNNINYGEYDQLLVTIGNPGELFIIVGDPNILNDGRIFIYTTESGWVEIIPSLPILDTRYLSLRGKNILINGSGIEMSTDYVPVNDKDVVTKEYIDDKINNSTDIPIATDLVKGIIQLSGDLSGTADFPIISDNAITKIKMAPLSTTNSILGSNNIDNDVNELNLSPSHFSISNNILSYIQIKKLKKSYTTSSIITVNTNGGISSYDLTGDSANFYSTSDSGITITQNNITGIFTIRTTKNTTEDIYVRMTFELSGMVTDNSLLIFKLYDTSNLEYIGPTGSLSTLSTNNPSTNSNLTVVITIPPMNTATTRYVQLRSFYQSQPDIVIGDSSNHYHRSCYLEEL